jgi:hypothetical protein
VTHRVPCRLANGASPGFGVQQYSNVASFANQRGLVAVEIHSPFHAASAWASFLGRTFNEDDPFPYKLSPQSTQSVLFGFVESL